MLRKLILLSLVITTQSTVCASWFNFWPFVSGTQICAQDLRSAAQEFRMRHDAEVIKRRQASNNVLLDEVNKPEVSEFFTNSKPSLSMGVFNTTEVAFIAQELHRRKAQILSRNAGIETDATNIRPEKAIKLDDYRDLPQLGKHEGNANMNKYCLYFTGSVAPSGQTSFHISLIERVLGMKRMKNRKTGSEEDVPCTKKMIHTMLIGTEHADGSFGWQKINNNICSAALQQTSSEAIRSSNSRRVSFQEIIDERK